MYNDLFHKSTRKVLLDLTSQAHSHRVSHCAVGYHSAQFYPAPSPLGHLLPTQPGEEERECSRLATQ